MNDLNKIFAAVLNIPAEQINDETSPENTPAWDSLNAIILITEIEKAFNLKFTYKEAMGVKNFGEVKKLVASKGAVV